MVRRIGLALGATLLALFMFAGAASAQQQYPPTAGTLQTDKSQAAPGEPITVTGTSCPANSTVTISFDSQIVGTTQARADGTFSFTFNVPSNATAGPHTIAATCVLANGQTRRMITEVTVTAAATTTTAASATTTTTAAAAAAGATLPRTGESPWPLAAGGLTLVGLGALAVIATRRRRSTT